MELYETEMNYDLLHVPNTCRQIFNIEWAITLTKGKQFANIFRFRDVKLYNTLL